MADLAEHYLAIHGGDRIAAAAAVAMDLMRGSPAAPQAAYTRYQALVTACEVFGVTGMDRDYAGIKLNDAIRRAGGDPNAR